MSYTGAPSLPTGLALDVVAGRAKPPERERLNARLCVGRRRLEGLSAAPPAYASSTAGPENAPGIAAGVSLSYSYANTSSTADDYDIGVYYFQDAATEPPADAGGKGLVPAAGDASEAGPLFGPYEQGDVLAAESNIEWAAMYGVDFFAYDWRWDGTKPRLDHAFRSYLAARNGDRLRFALIWMNDAGMPKSLREFDAMLDYMGENLLGLDRFYRVGSMPLLFVYSPEALDEGAKELGSTGRGLIERAQARARARGLNGIYFVAVTNRRPSSALGEEISGQGYSAYTGLNYPVAAPAQTSADYPDADYGAAYLAYASPSNGSGGAAAEGYELALRAAKSIVDKRPGQRKTMIAGEWNRPSNGPHIEPSKPYGFEYIEAIDRVFGTPAARRKGRGG